MGTVREQISQVEFDALLRWLDPERDRAAEKYEEIRQRLVKLFLWRRCGEAESLADDTINRVARKVDVLAKDYEGEPSLYFYAVARNVIAEYSKLQIRTVPLEPAVIRAVESAPIVASIEDEHELDLWHRVLTDCLAQFPKLDQYLLLHYYAGRGLLRINRRKELARELKMTQHALRKRVQRLRERLHKRIQKKLEVLSDSEI